MKIKAKWYLLLGSALLLASLVVGCASEPTKEEVISRVQAYGIPHYFPAGANPLGDWYAFHKSDGSWSVRGIVKVSLKNEQINFDTSWEVRIPSIQLLSAEGMGVKLLPETGTRVIRFNPNTGKFEEIKELN